MKFSSNFQPRIDRRDVKDSDDDLTREPEMIKAYRDTWTLGIHSYLSYLRDRLLLCRELLSDSGSVFVQISDENLHYLRGVMDEVLGPANFVSLIPFRKKMMPLGTLFLEQMADFLLWYAKRKCDEGGRPVAKYHRLYLERSVEGEFHYCWYELPDGSRHRMTRHQHTITPFCHPVHEFTVLNPLNRQGRWNPACTTLSSRVLSTSIHKTGTQRRATEWTGW